ncbi:Tn3 family transposase [Streptomyces sp. NPDC048266]|uniref:Tn3 family transposase n=1 Tax=Streptomyces sp. NPDC048266 TaxID=3155787 RepID=UPI0033CA37D8
MTTRSSREKAVNFNALLSNCLIFHNNLDVAQAVRELQAEGWKVEPQDLTEVSLYLTEKIMRFGEHSTHELELAPEAYEQHLDVDFAKLDPQDQTDPNSSGTCPVGRNRLPGFAPQGSRPRPTARGCVLAPCGGCLHGFGRAVRCSRRMPSRASTCR